MNNLFENNILRKNKIIGLGYSGFRQGQSPVVKLFPNEKQIREDLALIKNCKHLRLYSAQGPVLVAPVAAEFGLKIDQGIWLEKNRLANRYEVNRVIKIANQVKSITSVTVGARIISKNYLSINELITIIQQVKHSIKQPVGTFDELAIFLKQPELVKVLDFISIRVMPFNLGHSIDEALPYLKNQINLIKNTYPDKEVIIGDQGWPSAGQPIGNAVPSTINQQKYIDTCLPYCQEQGLKQFYFEAFDEKWKENFELEVGAHWGLYDINRRAKLF